MATPVTTAGLTINGVPIELNHPGSTQDEYVISYDSEAKTLELKPQRGLGGATCTVDAVRGNDSTGTRSGGAFKTIGAALSAAESGDCVYLLPRTYDESFSIPARVSLIGVSERAVTVQKLNVTEDITLVTMGENSHMSGVTLVLSSSEHHTLRGVYWPGTTTRTATWSSSRLTVDNSSAGSAGSSNVYGCYAEGVGLASDHAYTAKDVQIAVKSSGDGIKRGILVAGPTSFNANGLNVTVSSTGGSGSYIGTEINDPTNPNPPGNLQLSASTISGTSADVSQTAGTLSLGSVDLVNANANGKGFNIDLSPSVTPLVFADDANASTGTHYMRPGTSTPSLTPVNVRIPHKAVIRAISVRAGRGPGVGNTDTWTVQINGTDTAVTCSLIGTETSADVDSVSVGSPAAFDLSVKQVVSNSTTLNDVVVTVGLY